jgi:hypothetical protein
MDATTASNRFVVTESPLRTTCHVGNPDVHLRWGAKSQSGYSTLGAVAPESMQTERNAAPQNWFPSSAHEDNHLLTCRVLRNTQTLPIQ